MDIEELFKGKITKTAKITNIEIKKSEDVFGKNVRAPGRSVAIIYTEYGREAHALPKGIEYDGSKWIVKDEIAAVRSLSNVNSWFSRFYKKYGSFPKIGMTVNVSNNPRGFIVIEV